MAETEQTRQLARDTLGRLQAMEAQLRATQADVQGLPFLARGFVERDIKGSTGRTFADWIAAAVRVRQTLESVANGTGGAAAGTAIGAELPQMAVLRGYLQKAPEKVNAVPAAMLKPPQRAHFVGRVQAQVADLQSLEVDLGRIVAALGSAG